MADLDAQTLWGRVLDALSVKMAAPTIDAWLRPLKAVDATADRLGGMFLLEASNDFARDWASRHYGALVEEQLCAVTGERWTLHWTVAPKPGAASTPGASAATNAATDASANGSAARRAPVTTPRRPAAPRSATAPRRDPAGSADTRANGDSSAPSGQQPAPGSVRQPPAAAFTARSGISLGLTPRYTFDNFVIGPSNQLAHAASVAMAQPGGRRFNPLFLCGGTGLGKTHLVNAVGHRLLEQKADAVIIYVSAEHFTNEFIGAIQSHTMDAFRTRYRTACDGLLIDDIQFLAGREQTQEEFFHTFNALYQQGKSIVLTSDVSPQQLSGMAERLVSRFSSGLVAEIYAPEAETRIAIVRKKAEIEGIQIDDEAAFALATAVASNVRDLEGMLMKLAIKASLSGKTGVDVNTVREALRLPLRASVTTIEDVQRAVCEHYRVRLAELTGRDRHQGIALPRQVAMYLAREILGASFPQIGRKFDKDHTTVMSGVTKVKKLLAENDPVKRDVEAISLRLGPAARGAA